MAVHGVTPEQAARVLFESIEHFREQLGGEIPIQRLSVFLSVALNRRVQQRDISGLVDSTESSVSRHVMDLTYMKRDQKAGPELLAQIPDPAFRRRNLVDLTPKGEQLVEQLAKVVNKVLDRGS